MSTNEICRVEMKCGKLARARDVYERSMEKLEGDYEEAEMLYLAFAEFEQGCKDFERARVIYEFALDHIPKGRADELYTRFIAFEKQHGDKEGIEDAIVGRKRLRYEEQARKNPLNYDSWLEEEEETFLVQDARTCKKPKSSLN